MKKGNVMSVITPYAGNHRYLILLGRCFAAISALVALVPFYEIWEIIKIAIDGTELQRIPAIAWQAVGMTVFAMLLYVAALMCTHIAAFRVQANMRIALMERIMMLPLGVFDKEGTGKIRRIVMEAAAATETYIAHIRIGRKDAMDEEVTQAARMANCEQFILALPDGYHTTIGENGSKLSGGERQRISIARAFLKNAPIILLDEATASLDVENETVIQEALSNLIQDKTVLIIAHRMRTIANADRIIVLKDGVVAEQGDPSELVRKNSIFRHMAEMQLASAAWKI